MPEMGALLEKWRMDEAEVRRRMYRAPTSRERERWHAIWLLAQGWTGRRWAEPWSGMAIRLANGVKPSLRAVPKGWFLSRLVVPPALDVEQRADPVSSTG